jgi:glycosyltransferase involved in cell wall biosynthesis
MNIAHVTSFFQPGAGYQENCLTPAQARLGNKVTIFTSDRLPSEALLMGAGESIQAGRSELNGVTIVRLPSPGHWRAHNWVYLSGLWRALEDADPDIIHAHNIVTIPTWQVLSGNRRRRRPLVLDDHNNYFNIEPYTFKKRMFYAMFRCALRPLWMGSVKRVMPMSHEVRRLIHDEFGVPTELSTLVHLGADSERFRRDAAAGAETRARLGIPQDVPVIVNAGKITKTKDNHVLLKAFAMLRKQRPDARLLMIGNAPDDYRSELEDFIGKRGLEGVVTWVPFAKNAELPGYYNAADVGVWPGDWSITVLEAASCGLPLVLPDREYAAYSVSNDNGLLFERGNARELARVLEKLLANKDLIAVMGARSRELIEATLNWDAIARQTIDIYQNAIGDARP